MRYLFSIILAFLCGASLAQKAYESGDVVQNFSVKKILNYTTSVTDFNSLKQELIIIDFFGTWCNPCIKALPHLIELQNQYKGRVQFFLISTEDEGLLKSFIQKKKLFDIPLAIDSDKLIESFFQPGSYPYTVVINKMGLIIDIPSTAEMTTENIEQWLNTNQKPVVPTKISVDSSTITVKDTVVTNRNDTGILGLSADFIYAAKTGAPLKHLQEQLNSLTIETLKNELTSDDRKKAFWINIYNGFTQFLLKNNPEQYKSRNKFFKAKLINIAGRAWSLDEIEHGILRRSKTKWSLGYVNRFFPGKIEKILRVDKVDYRIHFALNCGAKSCPPIAFFTSSKINEQLNAATKAYLNSEAEFDLVQNTIHLPAIMSWFRADFGGKKNMRKLLEQNGVPGVNASTSIEFKKYDWSLYLNNYTF